jgi:putative FmdB family regulatory protein
MPIYEYQCEKCHHHLEALQKIADKPLRECPECGKHSLKRLVSAPMFRLAGSGWYETDFKSDSETKRNLAGRDEAPAEGAGKEAGDKKPADAPESKPAAKSDGGEQGGSKTRATPPASKPVASTRPAAKAARKPAPKKPVAKKTAKPTRKR